jgi:hypothetical protein
MKQKQFCGKQISWDVCPRKSHPKGENGQIPKKNIE